MAGNKNSGFAAYKGTAKHHEASVRGGKSCQAQGKAHRYDSTSGRAAGQQGGHISRGGRGRHADTSKATHPRAKA